MKRILPLTASMLATLAVVAPGAALFAPSAAQAHSTAKHGCPSSRLCLYASQGSVQNGSPDAKFRCQPGTYQQLGVASIYEVVNRCAGRMWLHYTFSPAACYGTGDAPGYYNDPNDMQITDNPAVCPYPVPH